MHRMQSSLVAGGRSSPTPIKACISIFWTAGHCFLVRKVAEVLRFSFKLYDKKRLTLPERFYTKVKLTLFTCLNLISIGVMAYFWYYDATLNENSYLAILIRNSTIKLSIFNFEYEEEKIRFKQIVLVFICGASLVSLLSFHIFFNFYCEFSRFGESLLINDNCTKKAVNKKNACHFNNTTSATKKNKNDSFI